MRPQILKITLVLLCLNSIAFSLSAQVKKEETKKEETKLVHIEMKDGNSVDGKLIARRGDTVVVESSTLGVLNLNIKNIKNIDAVKIENLKNGKIWFDNVHAPHGYFAPTGFNFRKGEGYYGNIFIFFNQIGYGFTDNFSVCAGTELISLLFDEGGDGWPQFFYINPKFSFSVDKSITIGAGSYIFLGNGFFDNGERVFAPYAVATLGNRNNNLSLGVGSAFTGGENLPILCLSGQGRLTRNISLMSENYFVSGASIGTTGFRFMNKDVAFNIGFMYSLSGESGDFFDGNGGAFVPIPFLGLNIAFGKKKK